jgi:hypothetical protein
MARHPGTTKESPKAPLRWKGSSLPRGICGPGPEIGVVRSPARVRRTCVATLLFIDQSACGYPARARKICLATLLFIDQKVLRPALVTWCTTLPPVRFSTLANPSTMALEVTSVYL